MLCADHDGLGSSSPSVPSDWIQEAFEELEDMSVETKTIAPQPPVPTPAAAGLSDHER